jgi:hypothetical protein
MTHSTPQACMKMKPSLAVMVATFPAVMVITLSSQSELREKPVLEELYFLNAKAYQENTFS